MIEQTFATAMRKFFGSLPGQSLQDFMAELKKLDDNDRNYFRAEFLKIGIKITN